MDETHVSRKENNVLKKRFYTHTYKLLYLMKDRTEVEKGLTIKQLCHLIYKKDDILTRMSMRQLLSKVRKEFRVNIYAMPIRKLPKGFIWKYIHCTSKESIEKVIHRLESIVDGIEETKESVLITAKIRQKRKIKKDLEEYEKEVQVSG